VKLLTERDCRVIGRPNVLILSDRLLAEGSFNGIDCQKESLGLVMNELILQKAAAALSAQEEGGREGRGEEDMREVA